MAERMRSESFYAKYMKRFFDIVVSMMIIICFFWLYLLCAIAIVIDTGLPVIYRQERCGKGGRAFKIYKFRTMVKNADQVGPLQTREGDSRITRTGRFLRRTSLDELPQVFNTLRGDMSIIGFRPDVLHENENYNKVKFALRPGITGYAQVNGRSSLSRKEREYWETRYFYEVSFQTDIKILIKTVKIVINRTGTN